MKVFVATSFSTQVDEKGNVDPEFRHEVEGVLAALREAGHEVICAVETHKWVIGNQAADDGVREDIADIEQTDVIVALLGVSPSAGVQFEIGYAVHAKKRVILVAKPGTELGWFNQGLVDAGLAEIASVENLLETLKS
jgi:nucleoside 2-deoxyribosyltransferase